MVKFRAKQDSKRIGLEEYEYSILAKRCGIEMPETRLFEDKYFGVERFDRTTNGKLHIVSIAGLIGADYRIPSIDYIHIFQVCATLTHNMAELWKVYRLMVFNYLIDNKDDHARILHSYIAMESGILLLRMTSFQVIVSIVSTPPLLMIAESRRKMIYLLSPLKPDSTKEKQKRSKRDF